MKAKKLNMEIPGQTFWLIRSNSLSIKELVVALYESDHVARNTAAQALGRLGESAIQALPQLIAASTDPMQQVRDTAYTAINSIAPHGWSHLPESQPAISKLVQIFLNSPKESSNYAAQILEKVAPESLKKARSKKRKFRVVKTMLACIGLLLIFAGYQIWLYFNKNSTQQIDLYRMGLLEKQKVINPLLNNLNMDDIDLSTDSIRLLEQIDPQWKQFANNENILNQLIQALDSTNPRVRSYAAQVLGQIGAVSNRQAIALGNIAISDPYSTARLNAAKSLSKLGSLTKSALPLLVTSLLSSEKEQRLAAVKTLIELGPLSSGAIQALTVSLNDYDPEIRAGSAKVLGLLTNSAHLTLQPLINTLKDKNINVRITTLSALGELAPDSKSVVPEIINHLSAIDEAERKQTERSLDQIDPNWRNSIHIETILPDWAQMLNDKDQNVAEAHADALKIVGDISLPVFLQAMDFHSPVARKLACYAFMDKGLQAVPAIPQLVALLADNNWQVRQAAAITLGSLDQKSAEAVANLIVLLEDPYFSVKDAAVDALAAIGPDAADQYPHWSHY